MQSNVGYIFDRLLREVNRLFEYRDWLPIERYQITFYYNKLSSLSKAFQSFEFTEYNYVRKNVTCFFLVSDMLLVSEILSSKYVTCFAPPYLTRVGERLAFVVAQIYNDYIQDFGKTSQDFATQYFYFDKNKFKEPEWELFYESFNFGDNYGHFTGIEENTVVHQSASISSGKPKVDTLFGFLLQELNRLLIYPDWLPIQRCQISFYYQQLSFSKAFQTCIIVDPNFNYRLIDEIGLSLLVSEILFSKYVRSFDHPDLTLVGDRLASEVAGIYKAFFHDSPDFTSQFHFVKNNFQEYEGEVFVGFQVEASNLLQQLACITKKQLQVISIVGMAGLDDNNGGRIMLTTRLKDVALHAQSHGNPLCLRFLTEEESFDLFRRKAFITGDFLDDFSSIGKSIMRKCRGLPLAIVVIAGLLKDNFERDWWEHVAECVSSHIVTDENQYMDTLALSYYHLPQHLRPCFLSFGAFPEDHDIPVRKLIWLWIAEGFIRQDGTKRSLEDVAENYFMDLIRRSLVVVGKKGSDGAIKTCRIHDLLRDLCLKKAEEQNFSPDIYRYNKHSYLCPHSLTNPSTKSQLLLSTNDVRTIPSNCSCCSSDVSQSFLKDVSIVWDTSKLIRALDISSIELFVFPSELLQLVSLRYLELRFKSGNPPESISDLRELQTLIMSSRMNMAVPKNMWKIINLKHLCIKSGENLVSFSDVEEPILLENLQTMSLVSPTRPCQHILARTRNLRKLGLCGPLTTKSGDLKCPDLGQLMHLETLKLLNSTPLCKAGRLSSSIMFPESLKNLTVSNTYLDWKEAWVFEMIPNLEVLKLKLHAFVGKDWETSPEAFPRLKFLKLDELDIVTWSASRDHFPVLQRLQVYQCPYLLEIPEDFGNICTLEWIELCGCSDAATNSAREIQKEQESNGNDWLKILLNPGLTPS